MLVLAAVLVSADRAVQTAFDRELGERLTAVAASVATAMGTRGLLLQAGDDDGRLATNLRAKLARLRDKTEAARIVVVRAAGDELVLDSDGERPIGAPFVRARFDALELGRVRAGQVAASVLFRGPGGAPYKTGYAPLFDPKEEAQVLGYVAVTGSAFYFRSIRELRQGVLLGAALGGGVLLLLAVVVSRAIARPVRRLAEVSAAIGAGEWSARVPAGGPAEVAQLGEAMGQMQRSLEAREEELRLMLGGIAHELKNPLGGLTLFSELLMEDTPPEDPRRSAVARIQRETRTLKRIIDSFLAFARTPSAAVSHGAMDLATAVQRALEGAREAAARAAVTLAYEGPKACPFVGDPDGLRRAVANAVDNSIAACATWKEAPGPLRVEVRLTPSAGGAVIEVADTGPGLPPGDAEALFRPFVGRRQKGSGLGLALAQRVVKAHGGRLEWATRSGYSTCLRFEFPAPAGGANPADSNGDKERAPRKGAGHGEDSGDR